jgi:hypothetical protein
VKPIVQSAAVWAQESNEPREILYDTIVSRAIRSVDPFLRLNGQWIVRRLAPHTSRIELADLGPKRDEAALLDAMGAETANVHLGTPGAGKLIASHLKKQSADWLLDCSSTMESVTKSEWKTWHKGK